MAVLALSFCGTRLGAQENTGVWLASKAEQKFSREVPVAMTVTGQDHVRWDPEVFGKEGLKTQDGTDLAPPFPITIPVVIHYPKKAVRQGWEGQVVVAAEVLPDGSVGRMALARSSGHDVLDQAAQEAVKTWKFTTESENNDAVPQYVDIPVTFKLQDP